MANDKLNCENNNEIIVQQVYEWNKFNENKNNVEEREEESSNNSNSILISSQMHSLLS